MPTGCTFWTKMPLETHWQEDMDAESFRPGWAMLPQSTNNMATSMACGNIKVYLSLIRQARLGAAVALLTSSAVQRQMEESLPRSLEHHWSRGWGKRETMNHVLTFKASAEKWHMSRPPTFRWLKQVDGRGRNTTTNTISQSPWISVFETFTSS